MPLPTRLGLAISALLTGCLVSGSAGAVAGAPGQGCPLGQSPEARISRAAGAGKIVPSDPRSLQLCRYFVRGGKTHLARRHPALSAGPARRFARRLNRLPARKRTGRCEHPAGYVTGYFGYENGGVVQVKVSLGGCRLVRGGGRDALASSELIRSLVSLTSAGDVPYG